MDYKNNILETIGNTPLVKINKLVEDIPALVNQQRGLASSDARQGRFQPHLEANVASFAKWYADQWLRQS
jgi:hypothetical protein